MLIFNERTHTLMAKLLYVPVNVTSTTPTFCNPTPIYDAALDLQLCLLYIPMVHLNFIAQNIAQNSFRTMF